MILLSISMVPFYQPLFFFFFFFLPLYACRVLWASAFLLAVVIYRSLSSFPLVRYIFFHFIAGYTRCYEQWR